MYQSSTKVSQVKEEAVQPCIKEKDYPNAEDRTDDHRTTMLRLQHHGLPPTILDHVHLVDVLHA
jgi:hypothetical protein